MGAGIAQLAAQAGRATLLHDPDPQALAAGLVKLSAGLERMVADGRITSNDAAAASGRVTPVPTLELLAPCEIVIEAVPERLAIKLELFARLAQILTADCVLATNTSSLSITEIAAGTPGPERVVGLHFFNPAPVMRLVEVIAGEQTGARALALARELGAEMGKRVVDAADVAGFLVNRVNRPYSLESLQVLQERVAEPEQIDRIARTAGGFRMGPFELMDLIGIETNHAVAESLSRATFGEPRYRPSPLTARKVAAGHLGRKTSRGWYDYADGVRSPQDNPAPVPGGGGGRELLITGQLPAADAVRAAAAAAGYSVLGVPADAADDPWLTLDFGAQRGPGDGARGPRVRHLHAGSLHELEPAAAGLHVLLPLATAAEVTATVRTSRAASERLDELLRSIGLHPEHVADTPGLVLGRVVAQLINEAAFMIGEGNGTAADIDAGMTLGVNHPRGPIAWSRELGLDHVTAILDALHREYGAERYRTAPLLRSCVRIGAELG